MGGDIKYMQFNKPPPIYYFIKACSFIIYNVQIYIHNVRFQLF